MGVSVWVGNERMREYVRNEFFTMLRYYMWMKLRYEEHGDEIMSLLFIDPIKLSQKMCVNKTGCCKKCTLFQKPCIPELDTNRRYLIGGRSQGKESTTRVALQGQVG